MSERITDRMDRPFSCFLVAAEESGDRLGAGLMRALKQQRGAQVRFAGIGGHDMAMEGLTSLFPIDDLAIIGLTAIPRRLRNILRRIREAADAVIAARPDVLVIIDSPDFTHRVARRVRRALPSLPIVDYVSPSVWAWRPGRAAAMRAYVDHVLALLPFEPAVHARLGGPACSYVGHPIVEQIAALRPNLEEAARRLADPPRLLLLPGSRTGEIRRLLAVFKTTLDLVAKQTGSLDIVLPTVPHLLRRVQEAVAGWALQPRIVVAPEEKWAAFRTARAALAASGTVSLELAVAGVPTVIAYKVPLFEEVVARTLIQVPSIVLANLVIGENVVPEHLQRQAAPPQLAQTLMQLIADTPERRKQVEAFGRLDEIMEIGGTSPSARAAAIVLKVAGRSLAP
jgi:lipid-A-disaccharide synthase